MRTEFQPREFVWRVSRRRHRWEAVSEGETGGVIVADLTDARTYEPLREFPDLYRKFAALKLDRYKRGTDPADLFLRAEPLRAFADSFGLLGFEDATVGEDRDATGTATVRREHVGRWLRAVDDLRRAIEVHDAIRAGDLSPLERTFHQQATALQWRQYGSVEFRDDVRGPNFLFHGPDPSSVMLTGLPAAREWLAGRLTRCLQTYGVAPSIEHDPATGRLHVVHVPRNLLAALWWQFAQVVTRLKDVRTCPVCGKGFEIPDHGNLGEVSSRNDRKFCSDKCKSKDYRDRKAAAEAAKKPARRVRKERKK